MRRRHLYIIALLGAFALANMVGCGKRAAGEVTIVDGNVTTYVEIEAGCTVAEALDTAEIAIHAKDVVQPERTQVLSKEQNKVSITRYAQVTVDDGTQKVSLEQTGKTVGDLLEELKISTGKYDYINHDPKAMLTDGMQIQVCHRNKVKVTVDGNTTTSITEAASVQALLDEMGIVLGKKDRVKPKLGKKLTTGDHIKVSRVNTKNITVKEEIPFETKIEYSTEMKHGEQKETQTGVPGEKLVTYRVVYVNGKEESRTVVKEKVITAPVDRIVLEGKQEGPYIVSKQKVPDCDGSNHGYYIITWSDGKVEYEEY